MAHFAELNESNVVLRVCVVDNGYVPADMHVDGETWCTNFWGGTWKQTSYNSSFRKRFAGIGYTYDATRNAFIDTQPYSSWTLSAEGDWVPPVTKPTDTEEGGLYMNINWDEDNQKWIGITYTDEIPHTPTNYEWNTVAERWSTV